MSTEMLIALIGAFTALIGLISALLGLYTRHEIWIHHVPEEVKRPPEHRDSLVKVPLHTVKASTSSLRMPPPEISTGDGVKPALSSATIASKGTRFGTFFIDQLFSYALVFCVGYAYSRNFPLAAREGNNLSLVMYVCFFSYYWLFEVIWAKTPGKWLFGTHVINNEGGRPSAGQVIIRTICRFIPLEALSFFAERGWHDSIPNVQVVMDQRL